MSSGEPAEIEPSEDWEHRELYRRVKEAISALPSYFDPDIFIEGLEVEDLFALNSVIATAIEDNVVETLNNSRSIWDPNDEYLGCSFIRQSQTFPDVLFVKHLESGKYEPIMGIELKGWYLLSKEKEPSFRYKVTPDACAEQDLVVIFPWCLTNILSGEPEVFAPYLTSAKRASHYVDYYWQETRDTEKDTTIHRPDDVTPYPARKSDKIQDVPEDDSGSNYGRYSRSGAMDDFLEQMLEKELAGIPAKEWIEFLKSQRDSERNPEITNPSS